MQIIIDGLYKQHIELIIQGLSAEEPKSTQHAEQDN